MIAAGVVLAEGTEIERRDHRAFLVIDCNCFSVQPDLSVSSVRNTFLNLNQKDKPQAS